MIREAAERDLPVILDIYNDAILHTTAVYAYKAHTLDERMEWLDKKKQDGYPVFVYERDGNVVAYATYGPFRAWPAYKYTVEHSVYVHKDSRNQGIAKRLMNELIDDANRRGYATLIAGIDATNAASIKLHERLGFEYSGTIKRAGYKFGEWLDLAFYQMQLQGPRMPTEG